jgi:hypothetical protein
MSGHVPWKSIDCVVSIQMNNHSVKSWRSFLGQNARDDIEATRKKMSIAYRKAQSAQADEEQLASAMDDDSNHHPPSTGPPSGREPTLEPHLGRGGAQFQEDLEAISRFFAQGGGDEGEEDDAHVWRHLTSQVSEMYSSGVLSPYIIVTLDKMPNCGKLGGILQ